MKDLKLILKRKWYDLIDSGEKKEEYREIKSYWGKRLTKLPDGTWWELLTEKSQVRYKEFDTVTFYLGYAKDRPSMTFKIENIAIGEGKPEWGAEPDRKYFVIKLGERI